MHIVPHSKPPSERMARRVEALSVLPVFYGLNGKTVVLAGGSDAAAWKAELLAATGARVALYAREDDLGETMRAVIAREPGITHHDRPWSADCLVNAALAIADAASEGEAKAFACAARTAGVPVNVIDRPAYCGFQFGSIVNRSPVVVGISTDGAAPVLGQAIRRRIETVLPAALGAWGAMAQRLRGEVNRLLAPGSPRRQFWEGFVTRAFAGPPEDGDARRLLESAAAPEGTNGSGIGHVTFVGAGPGDPEHLTLKAMRALQAADAILFDDLVSDGVLELARREAKRILVGKRAGRPSCRQSDINEMMVDLARAGRTVVRLKSGDPMIFGRAGEEMARLDAEGIAYSVVPGVTAGAALAGAFAVSLTHRDCARSVRFVTGHSRNGGLPDDIDLDQIAAPSETTIVYMGGRTADDLAAGLILRGLDPASRLAIGYGLGRKDEWTGFVGLADLARHVAVNAAGRPVVIGIGQVFHLAAAKAIVPTLELADSR